MEKIKITFLGTGNAIPTKKRNHTAILLTYKNENILIDCGEATQRQFRIANLSPAKITKILLTHWHGDHILGLPGLFQTLIMSDYTRILKIYGPRGTKHYIESLKQLFNLKIKLETHEVSGKFAETNDFSLESAPMKHGIPTNAYSFTLRDKLRLDKTKIKKLKLPNSPLLKQLQQGKDITYQNKKISSSQVTYGEKGKKIAFILDTAPNENTIALAKNSDILICEASFLEKEKERAQEYKHLTAKDSAEIAKKAKVKSLILTHISQRYEHNTKPILQEAKKIFPQTKIVNDFDELEI